MKKFDKIRREGYSDTNKFQPDELVYVEEKLDGANFRVWRDENNELRFGSRTVEFLPEGDENVGYGNFTNTVEYIKSLNTSLIMKGYIYYFEAMHKHTINYDWENTPRAVLIDIYDVENYKYFTIEEKRRYAKTLRCDRAKVIFEGEYKDFIGIVPKSIYYDGLAEGYVIKPFETSRDIQGNIHRAKVVRQQFKEENKATFSGTDDKESKFVDKFVNDARIEKHINKIKDNIGDFELKHITSLSYNIMKDICDEEFKKLRKMNIVNFNTINKEIMIRVKRHLTEKGML